MTVRATAGRNSGKKVKAVRIVRHTCAIIHLLTGENPIQVLVDAVINAGPREDSCRVGSAGVVRRQAVDISPLRRVNQVLLVLSASVGLIRRVLGPLAPDNRCPRVRLQEHQVHC